MEGLRGPAHDAHGLAVDVELAQVNRNRTVGAALGRAGRVAPSAAVVVGERAAIVGGSGRSAAYVG